MDKFELVSEYKMMGDQPQAVARLAEGLEDGLKYQTLMVPGRPSPWRI